MDKLSYALGMSLAYNLVQSGIKDIDIESFTKAFSAVVGNANPDMSTQEANQTIQAYFSQKQGTASTKNKAEGEAFLAQNKTKEGVIVLPSGLQYEILKEGTGPKPKATDRVKTHYHGTLIDGTVFDSSVQRGQPSTFGVNQVIKGWVEALQLMPLGSKWRLYIPSDLAYGSQGAGGSIEPDSALIFDIELLGIE
ncbi:MAG: FKBP-type peptidyl-prolyl cis-trans isomerase [Dysgonamonadaceae bacterium]|jgi:FKBP-type peptidyl-prolyl cis-trans isomerase FklB|nr:FKBP-type peptidyl-prolyl cis-trans isomerase [Dysgonamonadaceae bacterium]